MLPRAAAPVTELPDETVIDVHEPDNEPTTIRPPIPPGLLAAMLQESVSAAAAIPHKPNQRGATLAPGGRVGKYELRERLGHGAFGFVFTARDPNLDRDVAIKVLNPAHLANQDIVQRFLQEARAAARITHPGIVTMHDCGQVETSVGATAFIAMELLSGESLTSRLARSVRLDPQTATEVARQVASALDAAHRADVLHRDLKPDNIYLVPDPAVPSGERVKVLDFGLAKLGTGGRTQAQIVFGTPRYMSPEQCRSATQIDQRSDIYSLGCILFELVVGRPPFDGDLRQLIERHQRASPPRARSFALDCPPALDDLIAEMLAKDPMARPQTMGAVQRALRQVAGNHAPIAAPALFERPPSEPDPMVVSGEVLVPASGPNEPELDAASPFPHRMFPRPGTYSKRRLIGAGAALLALVAIIISVSLARGRSASPMIPQPSVSADTNSLTKG